MAVHIPVKALVLLQLLMLAVCSFSELSLGRIIQLSPDLPIDFDKWTSPVFWKPKPKSPSSSPSPQADDMEPLPLPALQPPDVGQTPPDML